MGKAARCACVAPALRRRTREMYTISCCTTEDRRRPRDLGRTGPAPCTPKTDVRSDHRPPCLLSRRGGIVRAGQRMGMCWCLRGVPRIHLADVSPCTPVQDPVHTPPPPNDRVRPRGKSIGGHARFGSRSPIVRLTHCQDTLNRYMLYCTDHGPGCINRSGRIILRSVRALISICVNGLNVVHSQCIRRIGYRNSRIPDTTSVSTKRRHSPTEWPHAWLVLCSVCMSSASRCSTNNSRTSNGRSSIRPIVRTVAVAAIDQNHRFVFFGCDIELLTVTANEMELSRM